MVCCLSVIIQYNADFRGTTRHKNFLGLKTLGLRIMIFFPVKANDMPEQKYNLHKYQFPF
jgi:hypothetical protein